MMKYFMPNSLTCLTGIFCFAFGTIQSVHGAYNLDKLGDVLVVMTSVFSPSFMIAQGLVFVWLHGAVA